MFKADITDVFARIMATYMVQMVLGLVVASIFLYFSVSYKRRFLRSWALSWLAFAFYMLGMFFTTWQMGDKQPVNIGFTMLSQTAAFLQILFLLSGTFQFIKKRRPVPVVFIMWAVVIVSVAIVSVLLFHNDPTAFNQRYALRYGLRTFLLGSGYLLAAWLVFFNRSFVTSFGQQVMAIFFFLFSLDQFYYFTIILVNLIGGKMDIPSFFGVIDMMLIAFIGLGMILWLLEDEREKLRKTNKELDSFLYSTSHDLRAPLASVLGIANIAKYEVSDDKALQLFKMIESRAKKLDAVIGDILNLARSKKMELKMEQVDFNKVIEEIYSDVKVTAQQHNVELKYQADSGHFFSSDKNQIKIILGNLISNAVKYQNPDEPHPYVEVKLRKDARRITITIADNGIGIPEDSQPKIFEMFYRASLATEGTGLGLYIAKEAVQKLGGEITFTSDEGQGTTFKITLPYFSK
jgi:signal transduction histidine kinase